MHAAHERIMYERLKVAMASEGLSGQPLLVPETLALSQREADCAEEHAQWFQRLGFELQRLGRKPWPSARSRLCSSRPRPTAWCRMCWPT